MHTLFFESMISFILIGQIQMTRLQQQRSWITTLLLNVFQTSLLYFLQICMLCFVLLIEWRWQMVVKEIILFSQCKVFYSGHFRPRLDHPRVLKVLEHLHWLVQFQDKRHYFIGFPVLPHPHLYINVSK